LTYAGEAAYITALETAATSARQAANGALHMTLNLLVSTTFKPLELDPYRDYPRYYVIQGAMRRTEQRRLAEVVRDIFGNPFRPTAIDRAWLAWNDATVLKLAQGIYEDRAIDRLPILADALEEAGCTNAGILTHCRRPQVHARGCWVVDALLDKS
jgi:hypothetical protein